MSKTLFRIIIRHTLRTHDNVFIKSVFNKSVFFENFV